MKMIWAWPSCREGTESGVGSASLVSKTLTTPGRLAAWMIWARFWRMTSAIGEVVQEGFEAVAVDHCHQVGFAVAEGFFDEVLRLQAVAFEFARHQVGDAPVGDR